jgi:hypothetical protein
MTCLSMLTTPFPQPSQTYCIASRSDSASSKWQSSAAADFRGSPGYILQIVIVRFQREQVSHRQTNNGVENGRPDH